MHRQTDFPFQSSLLFPYELTLVPWIRDLEEEKRKKKKRKEETTKNTLCRKDDLIFQNSNTLKIKKEEKNVSLSCKYWLIDFNGILTR